jgi:hypothetical protein
MKVEKVLTLEKDIQGFNLWYFLLWPQCRIYILHGVKKVDHTTEVFQ